MTPGSDRGAHLSSAAPLEAGVHDRACAPVDVPVQASGSMAEAAPMCSH